MRILSRRLLAVVTATLLGAPLLAVTPASAADDVTINLVGINDFHGRIDSATVQWAGTIKQLEAEAPGNSLLVSAGDNISASLFASAVQDDNPTIDVLNAVGLDASATGNHEFDHGYDDLVNRVMKRADFPILGANVKKSDGSDALDPSATFDIDGVKVAIIGAVTQETPTLVSPAGVAGLDFGDPVAGINAEVTRLKGLPEAERPDVMVASFHEGAPDGTLTLPQAIAGSAVFRHLVEDTSADVDAIFMGHTHQKYAYEAPVPGVSGKTRPIIQTGNYGENVGQIKLQVNPDTGDVSSFSLKNTARIATSDADLIAKYPDLSQVKKIRDDAVTFADGVGGVPKGEITGDITRALIGGTTEDRGSESTAGGLVADALLETVAGEPAGADIGIVNPGGLRPPDLTFAGIPGSTTNTDGVVTFAELNSVLPFANNLNSVRLSGTSLKKVLEQQWQRDASGNVPSRSYLQLGVSKNVSYTFDATRPEGSRITSVLVNGAPLDPDRQYKVATFSFLATGGDNFRAFKEGVNTDTGLVDRDGWVAYFEKNSPISPDFAKRSVEVRGVAAKYGVGTTGSITFPRLDLTSLGSPANTRVYSKVVYGDGKTVSLPSRPVTSGAATIPFTLPEGQSGSMRIESEVFPSRTKIIVPIDVTGAAVKATAPAATFGDDVPVTVAVSGPTGIPAGTVTLTKGDQVVGSGSLGTGGSTTITVDSAELGAGSSTLTATYGGNGASYPAATGTVDVAVAKAGTTTAAPDPAPTKVSDDAAVSVTVESATGSAPTGTVTVSAGSTVLGTGQLVEGAAAISADVAGLPVGPHELTVAYTGDANHSASTTTIDLDVIKGSAGLTATATGAPYGTSTVVQVVGQAGATGVVYVGNGALVIGIGFLVNGRGSVALPGTALVPGTYALGVFFGGSESFDAVDTTVGVAIAKGTTAIRKVSVSPTKIVRKRTRPFINLKVTGAGFAVDGGKITLRQGGKNYTGTVKGGKARIRLGKLTSSGSAKKVTATYSGNGVANGSSTTFTIRVLKK